MQLYRCLLILQVPSRQNKIMFDIKMYDETRNCRLTWAFQKAIENSIEENMRNVKISFVSRDAVVPDAIVLFDLTIL